MATANISKKDVLHTQYYDSTYMAEALDSAFDIEHYGFDDGSSYWDIFQKLLRENRSQQSRPGLTVVLDVGAGSRRIFRKIGQKVAKAGEDLTDVGLIGLNKSPTKLERAQQQFSQLSSVGTVSWLVGDANNLLAQPPFI